MPPCPHATCYQYSYTTRLYAFTPPNKVRFWLLSGLACMPESIIQSFMIVKQSDVTLNAVNLVCEQVCFFFHLTYNHITVIDHMRYQDSNCGYIGSSYSVCFSHPLILVDQTTQTQQKLDKLDMIVGPISLIHLNWGWRFFWQQLNNRFTKND